MISLDQFMVMGVPDGDGTLGVVPVLIGPLQTFIAILPTLLLALGGALISMFKPSGIKKLGLFFWHQKVFSCTLVAVVAGLTYGSMNNWWREEDLAASVTVAGRDWSGARGGPWRSGSAGDLAEPLTGGPVWAVKPNIPTGLGSTDVKWICSSPSVVGNRVYFASCEKGPFVDRGGIHCVDADTGRKVWTYSPKDFRATFSSPSVVFEKNPDGTPNLDHGYLACGEGLHYTNDARVTCLRLTGDSYKMLWEFHTRNHVESTPYIHGGKVYVGAGDDGYYCFDLEPDGDGKARVVWHKGGVGSPDQAQYRDCETNPLVVDLDLGGEAPTPVCFVGLGEGNWKTGAGEGGKAILALDADTGEELWRIDTQYPVFAPATVAEGKLFVGMGNGNFIESAEQVRTKRIGELKERGLGDEAINRIVAGLAPGGGIYMVDLAALKSRQDKPSYKELYKLDNTVLGAIAYQPPSADRAGEPGRLYFGSNDKNLYCITTEGKLVGKFDAKAPLLTSPAVGPKNVYVASTAGMLYSLRADSLALVWAASLGSGTMFMSSPALARGHLYVGTERAGLRCMGQMNIMPTWADGAAGGFADPSPLQDSPKELWHHPYSGGDAWRFTAPLMPLPELLEAGEEREPAPYVYAAAVRDGKPVLLKMLDTRSMVAGREARKPNELWAAPLGRPVVLPPAGVGVDLYLVEGAPPPPSTQPAASTDAQPLLLRCLDAENNGREKWNVALSPGAGGQFTVCYVRPEVDADTEADRAGVEQAIRKELARAERKAAREIREMQDNWAAQDKDGQPTAGQRQERETKLAGKDDELKKARADAHEKLIAKRRQWRLADEKTLSDAATPKKRRPRVFIWSAPATLSALDPAGQTLWTQKFDAEGVGAPQYTDGLLLATAGRAVSLLDPMSGTVLWRQTLQEPAVLGAVRAGRKVLAATETGIEALQLADGDPVRLGKGTKDDPVWMAAVGRPVQPLAVGEDYVAAVTAAGRMAVVQLSDGQLWRADDEWVLSYGEGGAKPVALIQQPSGLWYARKSGVDLRVIQGDDGAWYLNTVQPQWYFKAADGWYARDKQDNLARLMRMTDGWYLADKDRRLTKVAELNSDSLEEGWYVKDNKDELLHVTSAGSGWTVKSADGQPLRMIQSAGLWYVQERGATLVKKVCRLAPLGASDKGPGKAIETFPPLASGDRALCAFGAPGKCNLVTVDLPDHWSNKPGPGEPQSVREELVNPKATRWLRTDWMGELETPVVLISGQAYLTTARRGLLCVK